MIATDRDARPRLDVALRRALHLAMGVLLGIAVLRAWEQRANLAHGPARAVLASGLAVAYAVAYGVGVRRVERAGTRGGLAWVTALVAIWVVGSVVTEGFVWVAFPLYFLVLLVIPGAWGLAAVGSMVVWSVVAALVRAGLDGVPATQLPPGTWLGPLLGALCAVLAYAVFRQLRRDAERHRALAAELRAAQAEVEAGARRHGVMTERERLAREIHDTIAQGLGSIVMMARTARVNGDPDRALEVIEATARDNLAEARRFVHDLGSGSSSLEDAVRSAARDASARAGSSGRAMTVETRVEGVSRPLPDRVIDALHRGTQASLANVLRHARATRCVVTVTWWDDRVTVDIADDGVGFLPTAPAPAGSFGLAGLRARLSDVGGTATVESSPGTGTTVVLEVPSEEER